MSGIYIHIPFCRKKCFYCNFFSVTHLKQKDVVIDAIIAELFLQKNYLTNTTVETIYFGGGTPTLIGIQSLERILDTIYKNFSVSSNPEITIEANPDDLSLAFSQELKKLCNRLSIGIQSFNETELQFLGRLHHVETAKKAINNVRSAGFENLSLDLIYGINNDIALFQNSLETILLYHPEHISAYTLTCEPNTIFEKMVLQKKRILAADDAIAEQYLYLIEKLRNSGYQHYEISNFSLPDKHSIHNSNYWNGTPYLGVGPAAHSFSGNVRQWNTDVIEKYVKAIQNHEIAAEKEELTEIMHYEEFVMLTLRTTNGISLKEISERFGKKTAEQFMKKIQKYLTAGVIIKKNDVYRIAETSFLISDTIIAGLI